MTTEIRGTGQSPFVSPAKEPLQPKNRWLLPLLGVLLGPPIYALLVEVEGRLLLSCFAEMEVELPEVTRLVVSLSRHFLFRFAYFAGHWLLATVVLAPLIPVIRCKAVYFLSALALAGLLVIQLAMFLPLIALPASR